MTKQEFLDKALNVHGDKYIYIDLSEKILSYTRINFTLNGNLYSQNVEKHLRGQSPENKSKKSNTEEFIKNAKEIWNDKYDYSLTDYKNARTKVKIIFNDIVYEQLPGAHLRYPVENFLNQEIFLKRAIKKWGDKYDYSLVKFISTKYKVKIIYENVIYEQAPNNHLNYAPEKLNQKTYEDFLKEAYQKHMNLYSYEKVVYVNYRTKIEIICKKHGSFYQTPTQHLSRGCTFCKESGGEKEIWKYLTKFNIKFEREKTFTDCKNINCLKFDFYLTDYNICIEYDGEQHFNINHFFGGQKAYNKLKINDNIKTKYCLDNNIKLIRIPYFDIDKIDDILNQNIFTRNI